MLSAKKKQFRMQLYPVGREELSARRMIRLHCRYNLLHPKENELPTEKKL